MISICVIVLGFYSCCKKNNSAKIKIAKKETFLEPKQSSPINIHPVVENRKEDTAVKKIQTTDIKNQPQPVHTKIKSKRTFKAAKKDLAKIKNNTTEFTSKDEIYNSLKCILNSMEIGETATKQQLIRTKNVPKNALKFVKSIKKISADELEIKWKSKWIIEQLSDLKLNDARIKIQFANNLVYTSGDAIGIRYEDKVYTNLIIKGDHAFIPYNTKVCWRIRKK